MVKNYHAEIINMSLLDPEIINRYQIVDTKKRFCGLIKIFTISVPENEMEDIAKLFQKNLSTKFGKEWYITFHNDEKVMVVFRKRIFKLSGTGIAPVHQKKLDTSHAVERDKWDEMIQYAKSLGVPDNQCDFLPEDFRKREYC